MRRHPFILCAASAMALLCCVLALRSLQNRVNAETQSSAPPAAACGPVTIADEADAYVLFAQLADVSITRLSVVTPQSQYTFKCSDDARISVNGQKADQEVYETLLDQILTMPVVTIAPFVPVGDASATLTLATASEQYTATFYREADEESPYISIISGGADAPSYQRTDRWRLGTMLLACEGTRIQDEQGEETPFGD